MANRLTVLEEIIRDISIELYQKWYNALDLEERTEERSKILQTNANETSLWVIQTFMNKFNEAAEELKDIRATIDENDKIQQNIDMQTFLPEADFSEKDSEKYYFYSEYADYRELGYTCCEACNYFWPTHVEAA